MISGFHHGANEICIFLGS